jgi:NADH-quinone oxidoreductase subunit B
MVEEKSDEKIVSEDMGVHVEQQDDVEMRSFGTIKRWATKRSLWMVHYCTGCGGIELAPLMTSRFDMERFGMHPMVTPRQSDILLVTGYVNIKTLKRIVRTYEQMPDPKYVVAFGSCPLNGGPYWDSHVTTNHLDKYIPVDIYIAGCMPRPQSIVKAFNDLMDLIQEGKADGYLRYKKYYDKYKANQERIFRKWW